MRVGAAAWNCSEVQLEIGRQILSDVVVAGRAWYSKDLQIVRLAQSRSVVVVAGTTAYCVLLQTVSSWQLRSTKTDGGATSYSAEVQFFQLEHTRGVVVVGSSDWNWPVGQIGLCSWLRAREHPVLQAGTYCAPEYWMLHWQSQYAFPPKLYKSQPSLQWSLAITAVEK